MDSTNALWMILFASFLWGSWGQFIKKIGTWPLQHFMFYLYLFSLPVTWGALFLFNNEGFYELFPYLIKYPKYLLYPLLGGILYTVGMWYNIVAVSMSGLAITYIIFSSIGILFGTGASILLGGLPQSASLGLVILGCLAMLLAVSLTIFIKTPNQGENKSHSNILGIATLSGVFISSFPIFMTLGMKTSSMSEGLTAYQYMALLSVGSFIAVLLINLIFSPQAKVEHQKVEKRFIAYTMIAACAHYGGNVIQAAAAPVVGLAIAWPLGQTMVLWSIIWGLIYGEFKGIDKKSYLFLGISVVFFFLGIIAFSKTIYS